MTKLRFGLIGAGTHGQSAIIPAFAGAEHCELKAVADRSAAHLDAISHLPVRRYQSLHQMLENEDLDALYIATLASSHCELALQAFERGLHVICEKPLAADATEARRMKEAADAAGRLLLVMFENRCKPHYLKVREWIAEGAIGRVEAVHLQSFGKHPAQQPRRTNLLNEAGCLDCGIHMLDLSRFWTGGGEWEEIRAMGAWFGEETIYPPHLGILARLNTGVIVTFEDSFSYGRKVSRVPWNFSRHTLALIGTDGVIVDGNAGGQLCFQLVSNERMEMEPVMPSHHREEIREIVDTLSLSLANNASLPSHLATGVDGVAAQVIVDEVNRQCVQNRFHYPVCH